MNPSNSATLFSSLDCCESHWKSNDGINVKYEPF